MCSKRAAKIQKQRIEVEVGARASWGAAVLRPYTDIRDKVTI